MVQSKNTMGVTAQVVQEAEPEGKPGSKGKSAGKKSADKKPPDKKSAGKGKAAGKPGEKRERPASPPPAVVERTGPDPEPECPVFGVARFSLHRLAQGDLCTKLKANIVPITKLKVGAPSCLCPPLNSPALVSIPTVGRGKSCY
eukprot:767758-Prorocentrum_minimum.AAC.2